MSAVKDSEPPHARKSGHSRGRVRCLFSAAILISLIVGCRPQQPPVASSVSSGRVQASPSQSPENCQHLRRVNKLIDLLVQMHENLDSTCIFETPLDELERKWGIKIFTPDRYPNVKGGDSELDGPKFFAKPYTQPADAFVVMFVPAIGLHDARFSIVLTPSFSKEGGEYFQGGKLPPELPRPRSIRVDRFSPQGEREPIAPGADLLSDMLYFWNDPDRPCQPIISFAVVGTGVTSLKYSRSPAGDVTMSSLKCDSIQQ